MGFQRGNQEIQLSTVPIPSCKFVDCTAFSLHLLGSFAWHLQRTREEGDEKKKTETPPDSVDETLHPVYGDSTESSLL